MSKILLVVFYLSVKILMKKLIFLIWGSTTRTKVKEIAQMVIDEMGLSASIEYTGGTRGWIGDVPEFRYDLTKINTLGWSATYNSNDSVRIAIQKALGK